MDNVFTIKENLVVHDLKAFKSYLRSNKITKEQFIKENFNKLDLYTKEPLIYKNEEQYFNNDFNTRENLIEYFLICSDPLQFCLDFFRKRKARKGLIYAPSHIELKSYIAPSVRAIEKRGINYNELMDKVGLINRFNYGINKLETIDNEELIIVKDTREQKPLKFNVKTETSKLDFGDYVCLGSYFSNIYIERKSLPDFIGTLCPKNIERFKKEIERAENLNSFIFIIIESNFNQSFKFNKLSHIHSQVSPDFVFHNLRLIMEQFSNCQFLFCNGRIDAARIIEKIFRIKNQIKNIDLQYHLEFNQL